MKGRSEADPRPTERQLTERCRRYEPQVQEQAKQLADFKVLLDAQREAIQRRKDTIAILKGQKGRPKIKPSQREKGKPGSAPKEGGPGSEQTRAGAAKRDKTAHLTLDQTEIRRPEQVPPGSLFKG